MGPATAERSGTRESTGSGSVARPCRPALLDRASLSVAAAGGNAGPLPLRAGRPRIRQHSDQAQTLRKLYLSMLAVPSVTSREHREGAGIAEICSRLVDPVSLHFWGSKLWPLPEEARGTARRIRLAPLDDSADPGRRRRRRPTRARPPPAASAFAYQVYTIVWLVHCFTLLVNKRD